MKTLILEYDDFHWKSPENCIDFIYKIVYKYPDIKISLFTTPIHSGLKISDNLEWCNMVRRFIESENICLAVHGTFHSFEEYKNINYDQAYELLLMSEEEFKKANLKFVKVFRGPNWGINQHTYDALIDLGYTHVYTHENYKDIANKNSKIKNIIYNWNLKDEVNEQDILIAHGHTFDVCFNGIENTFFRVENFLKNNQVNFKMVYEI